jgi:L-glyceraldehyde 3-phosphate reductase
MLNRWIEQELLDVLGREGVGCIVFSPLAQGMLTDKYLDGIPEDSRVARGNYLSRGLISDEIITITYSDTNHFTITTGSPNSP